MIVCTGKRSINTKETLLWYYIVDAVLWGKPEYTTKVLLTSHGLNFKLAAAVHDHFLWLRPTYKQRALPVWRPIVKHDICDSLNKHHLDVAVNQTIKLQKKLPNGEKAAHQLWKRVSAERTCSFAQVQGSNPGDNWEEVVLTTDKAETILSVLTAQGLRKGKTLALHLL